MKINKIGFSSFDRNNTDHLSFAVIMARHNGYWVFVKHKERNTFEIPGGRREKGEAILDTAKRELFEETGARNFHIFPVDAYDVHFADQPSSHGLLCYADIDELGPLPDSEIERVELHKSCPNNLTYPDIQPLLFKHLEMKTTLLHKVEGYDHVIWDWNGTLVDDIHVAVDAIGVLLEEYNLPAVTKDQYRQTFGFPVRNYYEKLGFDLEKVCFDGLCDRFIDEYNNKRAKKAKLFDYVPHFLETIRRRRKQSILSAASQWHLDEITRHYSVDHHFDHVFGVDNNYAASKIARGKELVQISNVPKEKTILIGDTDHDHEVADELGIDVLLVADGHQSYERLSKVHKNVIESRFLRY